MKRVVLIVLILVLLLSILCACGSTAEAEARAAFAEHNYQEVVSKLADVEIEDDELLSIFRASQALILFSEGRFENVIDLLCDYQTTNDEAVNEKLERVLTISKANVAFSKKDYKQVVELLSGYQTDDEELLNMLSIARANLAFESQDYAYTVDLLAKTPNGSASEIYTESLKRLTQNAFEKADINELLALYIRYNQNEEQIFRLISEACDSFDYRAFLLMDSLINKLPESPLKEKLNSFSNRNEKTRTKAFLKGEWQWLHEEGEAVPAIVELHVFEDDSKCVGFLTQVSSHLSAYKYEANDLYWKDFVFDGALPVTLYNLTRYNDGNGTIVGSTASVELDFENMQIKLHLTGTIDTDRVWEKINPVPEFAKPSEAEETKETAQEKNPSAFGSSSNIPSGWVISAGYNCGAVIDNTGRLYIFGNDSGTYRGAYKWEEIAAIAVGDKHIVCLHKDGTVEAVGENANQQCNVNGWENVVYVAAGAHHTLGVCENGAVLCVGYGAESAKQIRQWSGIVQVAIGDNHTVGLNSNGRVVTAGLNNHHQGDVASWTDVVAVAADGEHTLGLRRDGTVYYAGASQLEADAVSTWDDVVAVAAGKLHIVALHKDGTVSVAGSVNSSYDFGQYDVTGWTNIVGISAGTYSTFGVRADGSLIICGNIDNNNTDLQRIKLQCNDPAPSSSPGVKQEKEPEQDRPGADTSSSTAGAKSENEDIVIFDSVEKLLKTLTLSKKNAVLSAIEYLNVMSFSRNGLIRQLSSEYGDGFPIKDATFAVDVLEKYDLVDWGEQAIKSAESYLDSGAFSRVGLIHQLCSEYGESFSIIDATAAVDYLENHGLVDWKEQAVKSAESYMEIFAFSREELINQLTSEYGEGFTKEEAVYAATQVGY